VDSAAYPHITSKYSIIIIHSDSVRGYGSVIVGFLFDVLVNMLIIYVVRSAFSFLYVIMKWDFLLGVAEVVLALLQCLSL
jgi:hypothetical protein